MAVAEGKEENAVKDDAQQKEGDHVESDLSIAIDNLSLSSEWMTDDSTIVLADIDPGSICSSSSRPIHTT